MGATRFDTARRLIKNAGLFFTINKHYGPGSGQLLYSFSEDANKLLYMQTGQYSYITHTRNMGLSVEKRLIVYPLHEKVRVTFHGHRTLGIQKAPLYADGGWLVERRDLSYNGLTTEFLLLHIYIGSGHIFVDSTPEMLAVLPLLEVPRWIANAINKAINGLFLPNTYKYSTYITEDDDSISIYTAPVNKDPMTIPKFGSKRVTI